MKLQKRVDKDKRVDMYILFIGHDEALESFKDMTPIERGMIASLKDATLVSTFLKVLTMWAERIESQRGPMISPPDEGGEQVYEG